MRPPTISELKAQAAVNIQEGDTDSAENLYREILRQSPDDASSVASLARILISREDFAGATLEITSHPSAASDIECQFLLAYSKVSALPEFHAAPKPMFQLRLREQYQVWSESAATVNEKWEQSLDLWAPLLMNSGVRDQVLLNMAWVQFNCDQLAESKLTLSEINDPTQYSDEHRASYDRLKTNLEFLNNNGMIVGEISSDDIQSLLSHVKQAPIRGEVVLLARLLNKKTQQDLTEADIKAAEELWDIIRESLAPVESQEIYFIMARYINHLNQPITERLKQPPKDIPTNLHRVLVYPR